MIGRFCWLAAGAVLGVTGYRRASRLVRSIRPGNPARQAMPAIRPGGPAARFTRPAPVHRRADGDRRVIGPFARDVRDGMDIYLDRHSGQPGPTLGGQQVAPRLAGQAGINGSYPDTDNAKDG
jgi:hypothetical protein